MKKVRMTRSLYKTLATIRLPEVYTECLHLPPRVIEVVCLNLPRGMVYDPEREIYVRWDELPPLPPHRYEKLPDYAELCRARADKRVECIPESQWSPALREEHRRRKYRGWRLCPFRSDRGELIVVARAWTFSAEPPVEDLRAKVRALALYEGAPAYPGIPGERVEPPQ